MSYDAWKTRDGGEELRRGTGRPSDHKLHCLDCGFVGVFVQAIEHFHQTEHRLTYRGTVQDFSKFRRHHDTRGAA